MEERLWMTRNVMQVWIQLVDMKRLLFLRTDDACGCERGGERRKPSVSSVIPVIIRALASGWEALRVFDLTPENLVIWGRNAQMHLKDSILIESWSRRRETNLCLSLTINSFIASGRHLMSDATSGSGNTSGSSTDTGDQKRTSVIPALGNHLSSFREQIWERSSHVH